MSEVKHYQPQRKKKIKTEEDTDMEKKKAEKNEYSIWFQGGYRMILSSHLQLSKAWLLLKSYPHGSFGEKRDIAEKK